MNYHDLHQHGWISQAKKPVHTLHDFIDMTFKNRQHHAKWSSNPTPGHLCGQNYNSERYRPLYAYSCTLTTAKTWKQPNAHGKMSGKRIGGIYTRQCCCLAAKSIQILLQTHGLSLPGSSVHGTSQARILEGVAISFSRGSSQPRDQTPVSCLAGRFFTTEPPGEPYTMEYYAAKKEWNNAICSHIDGPRDYYTKWRQKEKDKYWMTSLICGI